MDLPEGVSFGEIRKSFNDNDKESGGFVVYLSIIFIYMLIAFLFESMLLPLSIILTIPLAAMGSVWIHYITGTDMDKMGLVGAILLVGIVVNNGIVLVDYTNQLRQLRDGKNGSLAAGFQGSFPTCVHDGFNDNLWDDSTDL